MNDDSEKILVNLGCNSKDLEKKTPLFSWKKTTPKTLSFYFCALSRPGCFHFFYEMICKWVLPPKEFHPLSFSSYECTINSRNYVTGHLILSFGDEYECQEMEKNLHFIEPEIKLGLESTLAATRILEIKNLKTCEKIKLVQEECARLIKKRPQNFDFDLFSHMQQFFVLCGEEFKEARSSKHLTRIVCSHYLFKKALQTSLEAFPERRFVSVKILQPKIATPQGTKKVAGLSLSLSFLQKNEVLEERHLLLAVESLIGSVEGVEGSFFITKDKKNNLTALYYEVFKQSGDFTGDEIASLKMNIAASIKEKIEEKLNPVFMPENEEEVMRNILALSHQVKYVKDLPQTVIHFHKQTQEELEFSVVIVRVVAPYFRSLKETFAAQKTSLKLVHNRTKIVGMLRKKYEKEAGVFRVAISKLPFIRQDHSIDLTKARGKVSRELNKILGDFRDYNGGIISKEAQAFSELESLLQMDEKYHFLLENFFYSLSPPVTRSLFPPEAIKKLFLMLLEAENIPPFAPPQYIVEEEKEFYYLAVISSEPLSREVLDRAILNLELDSHQVATSFNDLFEKSCFGVIFRNQDHAKSLALQMAVVEVTSSSIK